MDIVLLLARLLLIGVFLIAGIAKLADRNGSRQALLDFGVPTRWASPFATILPVAELAVAALLVPRATAWWGAIGATLLLLLFVAGIGINLAQGRKPDCHCFGQIHSEPAGWPTLFRNGLLTVVALFIVAAGRGDPGAAITGSAIGVPVLPWLIAATLFAGLAWVMIQLLQQQGRLLLRLDNLEERLDQPGPARTAPGSSNRQPAALPVGSPAPALSLPSVGGDTVTLADLLEPAKPALLIFANPECGPCNALLPEVGQWQQNPAFSVAVISSGPMEANRAKAAEHGIDMLLLQDDDEIAKAYMAEATPSALFIRPNGTVGSYLARGSHAVRELVARSAAHAPSGSANGPAPSSPEPTGLPIGSSIPPLTLPDLKGQQVALNDLGDKEQLVLFWNPNCSFCQQMLPDLKKWETNRTSAEPELLLISAGDAAENHAMGLSSRILLDEEFAVGRTFGAHGTPSAVLIEASGKVASTPAVGASGVLKLATHARV